jgi:hypothetical protein
MSASASSSSAFQASAWPTPAVRDEKGANGPEHLTNGTGRKHLDQLPNFVEYALPSTWPTLVVTDSNGARNRTSGRSNPDRKHHDGVTLNDAIVMWRTPGAADAERGTNGTWVPDKKAGQHSLRHQTDRWATPTQVHRKSEKAMRPFADGGQSSPAAIEQQAQRLTSSLQDRIIYPVGQVSSHPRRSLNPLFVEWLMGWPPGWTLLAWTDFACSATALSRFKQRMRSALLSLGSPPEAPPAQTSLFA